MRRKHLLYSISLAPVLLLCFFALIFLTHCTAKREESNVNVLLVSIDTLRPDHLSCYGYERKTSPTIDGLAEQGTLFENAVSSTTWTLPAHAALLTSLPDSVHGVITTTCRLDPQRLTLQEIMKKHGYLTAGFYSCPFLDPIFGLNQGFDLYEDCMRTSSVYEDKDFLKLGKKLRELRDTPGSYQDPSMRARMLELRNQMQEIYEKGEFQARTDVTSEKVSDKAIEWLKKHPGEKFFLFLHYFDPHYDFVPPDPWNRKFDPGYVGSIDGKDFMVNDSISPSMAKSDLNHIIALYDGEIAYTDFQLEKVVHTINELGLNRNTLIIIVSDHGEEFFEHGMKGHRLNLFDTTLRIPVIAYLPGVIPAARKISSQVRIIDIFPTILDYAGIKEKGEALGTSLRGLIDGAIQTIVLPALVEILVEPKNLYQKGLRTDEWKIIIEGDLKERNQRAQFFDLKKDPGEHMPLIVDMGPTIAGNEPFSKALAMMKRLSGEALNLEKNLPKTQGTDPLEIPEDIRNRLLSLGYIH